jgi:hypothetical protein
VWTLIRDISAARVPRVSVILVEDNGRKQLKLFFMKCLCFSQALFPPVKTVFYEMKCCDLLAVSTKQRDDITI